MAELPQTTILFLRDAPRVLLGYKKRGFGVGLWNGVGGKKENGESIDQTAVRECEEEIYVSPKELSLVGIFRFYFDPQSYLSGKDQESHVYFCDQWAGEVSESDEIRPSWFNESAVPYDSMWSYHRISMPLILGGRAIRASFHFDTQIQVVNHDIADLVT